ENHLPALVEALLKIDSNRMDEYEQAIRAQVCGTCPAQHDDQRCGYRDKGECALWTYLPLVVDAVFDVHKAFALAPRPAAGRKCAGCGPGCGCSSSSATTGSRCWAPCSRPRRASRWWASGPSRCCSCGRCTPTRASFCSSSCRACSPPACC